MQDNKINQFKLKKVIKINVPTNYDIAYCIKQ